MAYSLPPQNIWQTAGMKHCLSLLQEDSVEPLRDAIFFRCVMNRELGFCASLLEMINELLAQVFATTIGMKPFNVSLHLHLHP